MSRLFTFFLAAIVLMHATLGCCVHHAHSCEVDCCGTPAATSADCPCNEQDVASDASVSGLTSDSSHGHDAHRCEGDACAGIVATSSDDDVIDILSQPVAIACWVARPAGLVTGETVVSLTAPSRAPSLAPRLHLALAVLLI